MRYLLHIGLFALALSSVAQASADDDSDYRRGKKVVVAYETGPRQVRPVRASHAPARVIYDQRRTFTRTPKTMHVARRAYFDQRKDLEQIVKISERWDQATANRNREAQWKVNRRLDAWLEREIRESVREPRSRHYTERVRGLSHELAKLERRRHYSRGYQGRGYQGRGHYARNYHQEKASILNELIQLSERQLQRAEANLHYPNRPSFAYR